MEIGSSQEGRGDSNPGSGNSFVNVTSQKADGGTTQERDLTPLMTEPPRTVEGIELVIRGDSKKYRIVLLIPCRYTEGMVEKWRRLEPKDR